MHTVIETPGYLRKAKSLMSDAQREAVVTMIAADPSAGDVMTGTADFAKFALHWRVGAKAVARASFTTIATLGFRFSWCRFMQRTKRLTSTGPKKSR